MATNKVTKFIVLSDHRGPGGKHVTKGEVYNLDPEKAEDNRMLGLLGAGERIAEWSAELDKKIQGELRASKASEEAAAKVPAEKK